MGTYISRPDRITRQKNEQLQRQVKQDISHDVAYMLLYKTRNNPKSDPIARNKKAIAQEAMNTLYDEQVTESHRQWHEVERLMNCKHLDTTSGEHGVVRTPAPKPQPPRLTVDGATHYLQHGGYIRYDYAQQKREVFWGGRCVGVITNDILSACVKSLGLEETHMPRYHASKFAMPRR